MGTGLRLAGLAVMALATVGCVCDIYLTVTTLNALEQSKAAGAPEAHQQMMPVKANAVLAVGGCVGGFVVGLVLLVAGTILKGRKEEDRRRAERRRRRNRMP
jgi:hypothetical protein